MFHHMDSQSQDFQDDGDFTESLINNVQTRPAIYDASMAEHSDRNLVSGLWEEIMEKMVPTFQGMTSMEKVAKVKELQNKWKNLKTCFRRELNKQKKGKSGQAAPKRRKYVYFEQLSFLLPTMEHRPTISNCEAIENIADISEDDLVEFLLEPQSAPQVSAHSQVTAPKKKKSSYEDDLLAVLKEKKEEQIDEDKSFLLSLLPSFKKLTDVQKIELLGALKRVNEKKEGSHYRHRPSHSRRSYARYDSDSDNLEENRP